MEIPLKIRSEIRVLTIYGAQDKKGIHCL